MMLVRQPKHDAPVVRLVIYCDSELAVVQLLRLAGQHRRWSLTPYAQACVAELLTTLAAKDQLEER
jgi:hypothetical protein